MRAYALAYKNKTKGGKKMNDVYNWIYNLYITGELSPEEYEQMLYDYGYYDYDNNNEWIEK